MDRYHSFSRLTYSCANLCPFQNIKNLGVRGLEVHAKRHHATMAFCMRLRSKFKVEGGPIQPPPPAAAPPPISRYFTHSFRESFYQHCQGDDVAWRNNGVSKHTGKCEDKSMPWAGSGLACSRQGTNYGGFDVPSLMCFLPKGAVMLSFGCGEDISFDVAMAATYDIQVYLFDPTPRAKVHVESVLKAIATKYAPQKSKHKRGDHYVAVDGEEHEISDKVDARGFFDKIVQSNVDRSQFHYEPWALSDKDGEMSFMSPKSGVSHVFSAVGRDKSNMEGEITVPVKSMASILKLKHIRKVDLIKIDIEGYENKVIPGMLELIKTWPIEDWPKVLMFDFDSMLSCLGTLQKTKRVGENQWHWWKQWGTVSFLGAQCILIIHSC